MAHFIVDRKTWYRGKGIEHSRLLTKDGQRCCIGFVGQQCGIPDSNLLDRATIEAADDIIDENWPAWMTSPYSVGLRSAYGINDCTTTNDADREQRLVEIFAGNGDTIEFIN